MFVGEVPFYIKFTNDETEAIALRDNIRLVCGICGKNTQHAFKEKSKGLFFCEDHRPYQPDYYI